MQKKWMYLSGLFGILICFGFLINDQFVKLSRQLRTSVGEKFPDFVYETPQGETVTLDSLKVATSLILFVRDGCPHCENLERTLDSIIASNGITLTDKKIWLVSIAEPLHAEFHWATQLIYKAEHNQPYINAVPQMYLLSSEHEVLFKHVGVMSRASLEQKVFEFLR